MTRRTTTETDDRLDEVLAEIDRARREPAWVPEPERTPRRLISPPDALDGARWAPSRLAVVLMAIGALIAAAILAARLLLAGGDAAASSASVPGASASISPGRARVAGTAQIAPGSGPGATGTANASAPSGSGGQASAATGTSTAPMSIHVVGAVRHPGVVQVPAGSRVEDAVRAAGGLAGADSNAINLARPLTDGEQVHVPRPGETVAAAPSLAPPPATGPGISTAVAGASGQAQGGGGATVNLNTADAAALDSLPGVGPVLAQRIIEWRTTNGKFSSVDELGEVSGIGDKAMERLRSRVTV